MGCPDASEFQHLSSPSSLSLLLMTNNAGDDKDEHTCLVDSKRKGRGGGGGCPNSQPLKDLIKQRPLSKTQKTFSYDWPMELEKTQMSHDLNTPWTQEKQYFELRRRRVFSYLHHHRPARLWKRRSVKLENWGKKRKRTFWIAFGRPISQSESVFVPQPVLFLICFSICMFQLPQFCFSANWKTVLVASVVRDTNWDILLHELKMKRMNKSCPKCNVL